MTVMTSGTHMSSYVYRYTYVRTLSLLHRYNSRKNVSEAAKKYCGDDGRTPKHYFTLFEPPSWGHLRSQLIFILHLTKQQQQQQLQQQVVVYIFLFNFRNYYLSTYIAYKYIHIYFTLCIHTTHTIISMCQMNDTQQTVQYDIYI